MRRPRAQAKLTQGEKIRLISSCLQIATHLISGFRRVRVRNEKEKQKAKGIVTLHATAGRRGEDDAMAWNPPCSVNAREGQTAQAHTHSASRAAAAFVAVRAPQGIARSARRDSAHRSCHATTARPFLAAATATAASPNPPPSPARSSIVVSPPQIESEKGSARQPAKK